MYPAGHTSITFALVGSNRQVETNVIQESALMVHEDIPNFPKYAGPKDMQGSKLSVKLQESNRLVSTENLGVRP